MKKSELKQLIRECVKELTEALEYKLDSALIKKIKPAILKS